MANRKLGCLSIFLFVALCASVFMNFVLAVTAFRRLSGGAREEEPTPYFRETIVQRGSKRQRRQDRAHHAARTDQFIASGKRGGFDGGRHADGAAAGAGR